MRKKIAKYHPLTQFHDVSSEDIYIADFSRRTNGARSVEVHTAKPLDPNGVDEMDCLHLKNEKLLTVEVSVFDDDMFHDAQGNNIEHCECCLYPLPSSNKKWIAFVELKDCNDNNVLGYKQKMQRQIFEACSALRGIGIPCRNAYGLVSCPRRKTGFNDNLFYSPLELITLKRMTSIDFIVTNNGIIVDETTIRPVLR